MAHFYWRLKNVNKKARIMAELMESYDRVAVHRAGATPFASWQDDTVNDTFRQIVKEVHGALRILVVEDNPLHIESAKVLLAEHSVTVVSGFDQALDELERMPDVVLTDCMIPKGGDRTMSPEGKRLAESQGPMPYGPIIALHAIQKGVKKVGIITSGNHHSDPFIFAFDGLNGFTAGDVKVVCTNRCENAKGAKDWAKLLKQL
jgi:CheY-like chemotaxis protein